MQLLIITVAFGTVYVVLYLTLLEEIATKATARLWRTPLCHQSETNRVIRTVNYFKQTKQVHDTLHWIDHLYCRNVQGKSQILPNYQKIVLYVLYRIEACQWDSIFSSN